MMTRIFFEAAREYRKEKERKKILALEPTIKKYVHEYLDSLPIERSAAIIGKIIGASDLTDEQFKRIFALSGSKTVDIHFAGGDMVTISGRQAANVGGPGW